MRLPYVPEDPSLPDPADQAVVERVKERRGGKLIALDRALLHAPPVADGWNAFLKSIRTQTTLTPSIRELAICRVAALNKAWYEWDAHAPLLESTGAVSAAGIAHIKDTSTTTTATTATTTTESSKSSSADETSSLLLDEQHAAVLAYTDAMTREVVVPRAVFTRLENLFSEREVVELTATVAAYNCVSRFLVALDVGEMADKYGVDMN